MRATAASRLGSIRSSDVTGLAHPASLGGDGASSGGAAGGGRGDVSPGAGGAGESAGRAASAGPAGAAMRKPGGGGAVDSTGDRCVPAGGGVLCAFRGCAGGFEEIARGDGG